jgi:UDP-glucose:glycoprotein glucosyltransferase
VIDPLSVGGQRGLSLLELFHDHLHYSFSVVLVPPMEITKFPLEHFYRYVLSPQLPTSSSSSSEGISQQDDEGTFIGASFTNLPPQHVLTTRTDIPEPWNVQTMKAFQDIDNLRCVKASSLSGGGGKPQWKCGDIEQGDSRQQPNKKKDLTEIGYNLKSLLVFGQCFEKSSSSGVSAPNGLQLTLTPALSSSSSVASDTLVMKNLGYYQLQVPFPSLYQLNLAAGKANDLYLIVNSDYRSSVAAQETEEDSSGKIIVVKSFQDVVHRLFVMKRPGKEHIPLLEDKDSSSRNGGEAEKEGGFWKNLKSSIFGQEEGGEKGIVKRRGDGDDDTIHVFSLATGHLYERFLRIMMLSVIKSTKSNVKFWLFENYLSPKFKEIARLMMEKYHFEIGSLIVSILFSLMLSFLSWILCRICYL